MEAFLNPQETLKQLKLRDNMIAADFGCGTGGWACPLAKKLQYGKVYAIDILEEPLSATRAKAKIEKIFNLQTILADVEEGVKFLKNESCNLVLMTNLLFQCKNKKKVLAEGKRVLKEDGRILVVDWQEEVPFGPQDKIILPEKVKEIGQELDLKVEKEFAASPYHYALVFTRK